MFQFKYSRRLQRVIKSNEYNFLVDGNGRYCWIGNELSPFSNRIVNISFIFVVRKAIIVWSWIIKLNLKKILLFRYFFCRFIALIVYKRLQMWYIPKLQTNESGDFSLKTNVDVCIYFLTFYVYLRVCIYFLTFYAYLRVYYELQLLIGFRQVLSKTTVCRYFS